MAYCDYEHCPICDAGFSDYLQKKADGKNPSLPPGDPPWSGYKLLYMGHRDTPPGMVVLCEEHAAVLKPHIDALIEQAKI